MEIKEFLRSAANVKPSRRQLDWFNTEFYAFVHFSPNTYTDLEWGNGNENPASFNPVKLDCDQWVEAVKSAGMKGLVLTAKHHDGFCLWNTKYTEHCIRNSPQKRDIVREAADACARGGIKFGFYLSPWDRNNP
ncbi:MAG: alpha-L-fucosidase, partial [Eubacteriales bacterium]